MEVPKKAYFIGIGGIGMSALAQLYTDHGAYVTGSDKEESPTTQLLRSKGVDIILGQRAENVPEGIDLVVYTEAIAEDNPERVRAKQLGIKTISYFAALGEVSKGMRTIAVAGTHGKTTTTGMLAHILHQAQVSPTAIVGSIVRDFGSNYLSGTSDVFVVEACEYKRDFLTLTPEILVVTNIEFDHSDYYRDLADVQEAFKTLIHQTKGMIVTDASHPNIAPLLEGVSVPVIDYTKEPAFDLSLLGEFNQMNARAAASAAKSVISTLSHEVIAQSLKGFVGAWRRFEYKGKTAHGADVYDDYAHHPTAVHKTLAEARRKSKGKIFVAFHPHLFSRTRDFFEAFASSFGAADEVFLAPIYPAREIDDGSVSSEMLAKRIQEKGGVAQALSMVDIQSVLATKPQEGDMIITMGAGDIYKVADALVI